MVQTDILPLFQFLESIECEVEGRSAEIPPDAIRQKISQFLDGSIPESERTKFFEIFRGKRAWLAWFAEEIKRRGQSLPEQ